MIMVAQRKVNVRLKSRLKHRDCDRSSDFDGEMGEEATKLGFSGPSEQQRLSVGAVLSLPT